MVCSQREEAKVGLGNLFSKSTTHRAKRDAREDGAEDEAREQRDRRAAEGADGHAEEELPHDDGGAYIIILRPLVRCVIHKYK